MLFPDAAFDKAWPRMGFARDPKMFQNWTDIAWNGQPVILKRPEYKPKQILNRPERIHKQSENVPEVMCKRSELDSKNNLGR